MPFDVVNVAAFLASRISDATEHSVNQSADWQRANEPAPQFGTGRIAPESAARFGAFNLPLVEVSRPADY